MAGWKLFNRKPSSLSETAPSLSKPAPESSQPVDESGSHKFIARPGSDRLVILFSGTGKRDGNFDFWRVGNALNAHVLFVSDARNWWYQGGVEGLGADTEQTLAAIRSRADAHGVKQIITVGASMGGFGAVLYAARLGGSALAFSLDTILRLPTSPSFRLMAKDAPVHVEDLVPLIADTSCRVHVYVGEQYTIDLVGAERLLGLPSVTVESLRGVDHSTAGFVHLNANLVKVIDNFSAGRRMPKFGNRGDVFTKPNLVTFLHRAHLMLELKKYDGAEKYARHAVKADPFSEAARLLLGRVLLAEGRYEEAVRELGLVMAALPDLEEGAFHLTNAMRGARQHARSAELLKRYVERWPKSARLHFNYALTLERLKRKAEALTHVNQAQALEPRYAVKADTMRARIG